MDINRIDDGQSPKEIFPQGKHYVQDAKYLGQIFHDFRRSAAYELWKPGPRQRIV
jgi:hypothetical protein